MGKKTSVTSLILSLYAPFFILMFIDYEKQVCFNLPLVNINQSDVLYCASFDEVGRGCIFGPVTVGSVLFPISSIFNFPTMPLFSLVKDSKELSPLKRELYSHLIPQYFVTKTVHISVDYIEQYNINMAIQKGIYKIVRSFQKYLSSLSPQNRLVAILIDGNYKFVFPTLNMIEYVPPIYTIVKGDQKVFTIAAASIVAKVKRDLLMVSCNKKYKDFHIEKNKGYGTKAHFDAIAQHGITKLHRRSFLKNVL